MNHIDDGRALLEELAEVKKDRDEWKEACLDANARFKDAEARIREAELQKPVAYLNLLVWSRSGYDKVFATPERSFDNQDALYTRPIPPVDVAGLQHEIRELQFKLSAAIDALAERDDKEARLERELDKALKEGRKVAVPDGWQAVPKEVVSFWSFCKDCFVPITGQQEQLMISLKKANAAMIESSLQPEVKK